MVLKLDLAKVQLRYQKAPMLSIKREKEFKDASLDLKLIERRLLKFKELKKLLRKELENLKELDSFEAQRLANEIYRLEMPD